MNQRVNLQTSSQSRPVKLFAFAGLDAVPTTNSQCNQTAEGHPKRIFLRMLSSQPDQRRTCPNIHDDRCTGSQCGDPQICTRLGKQPYQNRSTTLTKIHKEKVTSMRISILLGSILLMAATLSAQTVQRVTVTVPFSFVAGNHNLPAGNYTIELNHEKNRIVLHSTDDNITPV